MPKEQFRHVDTWVFDMDHTLYPANNVLFSQIEVLMLDYFVTATGLAHHDADRLRVQYWENYGTSVAGLIKHHDVDPGDFLHTVHQIDFGVLSPNPELKQAIQALSGRKIVFTNGPQAYAHNVLTALDLHDDFEAVYGTEHSDLIPKPQRHAYEKVFQQAGIEPQRAAMFEDSPANLRVPHDMGMKTVLVHAEHDGPHIHHQTTCLPSFLRQIA